MKALLLLFCAFGPYLAIILLGRAQRRETGAPFGATAGLYILVTSFILLSLFYGWHQGYLGPYRQR
jgi:hypothetical protein